MTKFKKVGIRSGTEGEGALRGKGTNGISTEADSALGKKTGQELMLGKQKQEESRQQHRKQV